MLTLPMLHHLLRVLLNQLETARARIRCRLRDFLGETNLLYWAHIAKGIYATQLERWFSLFGRENIKVSQQLVLLA